MGQKGSRQGAANGVSDAPLRRCDGYGTLWTKPDGVRGRGVVQWPEGVCAGMLVARMKNRDDTGEQIALEFGYKVYKRYHWSYPQVQERNRCIWFPVSVLVPYTPPEASSSFPLLKLPPACLAWVFRMMSIGDAAYASLTCRATLNAFRDEVSWKW